MPFDWWTKRVRVNKPIDWANTWSLEAQARGLSFEMDDQMNLKAVPVVVVDTTQPDIVPAAHTAAPAYWQEMVAKNSVGMAIIHTPPVGMDSYVDAIAVYVADATLAVAGVQTVMLYDMAEANKNFNSYFVPCSKLVRWALRARG